MEEYDLLVKQGNIGIYNSCEVTELVIRESNEFYNLYTICVFQEKNVTPERHRYNKCSYTMQIDDKHSVCILQYELTLNEIKENFEKLITEYKWISNHLDDYFVNGDDLRRLNKQFIPAKEDNRLNNILKNNFFSGSYILEFFDEKKQFEFLTGNEETFEKVSKKINKQVPINLFKTRDRLGNFIFQFPVNILNVKTKVASDLWDSLNFDISWHPLIKDKIPDCMLEVNSILDNNYIGSTFEEYNKTSSQVVFTGNVDSLVNVRIWRKNPTLLLYSDSSHYIKSFGFNRCLGSQKMRYFIHNNKEEFISLNSKDFESANKKQEYYQYIKNSIGIKEKNELENTLSFKQYPTKKDKSEGLLDLKKLIRENGWDGVYLWDPYLTFEDIINTLFYCPFEGVELRALGSKKPDVRKIYFKELLEKEFKDISKKIESISDKSLTEVDFSSFILSLQKNLDKITEYLRGNDDFKSWVNEQKNLFSNLNSNHLGLNLEFRFQKGNGAHDRFLIFPGNSKNYKQPKVYSLGTSVNSFGRNYHILQEVLYPQAVVREFDKVWNESKENLIWKYPE